MTTPLRLPSFPPKTQKLGIIGGSGVYEMDTLKNARWEHYSSSFGEPSDALLEGTLAGCDTVFLPRHGREHRLSPSTINYRANIDILKRAGVTEILSVSAVGSLKENFLPGDFLLVDQFIDRTFARIKSFFETGLVAHVSVAEPTCGRMRQLITAAHSKQKTDAPQYSRSLHQGGTYLCMEGPQFSTRAESKLYRQWGCDVIGMTNMPEAKLAREAELCYTSIAMITDFDCWHPEHNNVDVQAVVKVAQSNAENVKSLIHHIANEISRTNKRSPTKKWAPCQSGCNHALESAIMTHPKARDPRLSKQLEAIAGRVLK